MKRLLLLASLISLGISLSAAATELTPLEGGTFVVGDHTASVYYTERGGLFEVVATVAPDPDLGGAPMRFVGSLGLGQKQIISVGRFGTTTTPYALELVHDGDRLVATVVHSEVASR